MVSPGPELLQKLSNTKALLDSTTAYNIDDMALNFPDKYLTLEEYYLILETIQKDIAHPFIVPESIPLAVKQGLSSDFLIVLCIDFPDRPAQATTEYISEKYFGTTDSVSAYFKEVSHGQYILKGKVYGWIRASNNLKSYGTHGGEALANEILSNLDTSIKSDILSYFPDGGLHRFAMVVSGLEAAAVGTINGGFWAHVVTYPSIEEKKINGLSFRYHMLNSEYTYQVGDRTYGVDCHEFGHLFYLPDVYSPHGQLGNYSLMGGGSWLNGAKTPCHLDAYLKWAFFLNTGTNSERILTLSKGNVVMYESKSTNANIMPYQGVYSWFFIEFRQKKGYDLYIPGEGLNIIRYAPYDTTSNRYSILRSDGTTNIGPDAPYLSNPSNPNKSLTKSTNPSTVITGTTPASGKYEPVHITNMAYNVDKTTISFNMDHCDGIGGVAKILLSK